MQFWSILVESDNYEIFLTGTNKLTTQRTFKIKKYLICTDAKTFLATERTYPKKEIWKQQNDLIYSFQKLTKIEILKQAKVMRLPCLRAI